MIGFGLMLTNLSVSVVLWNISLDLWCTGIAKVKVKRIYTDGLRAVKDGQQSLY